MTARGADLLGQADLASLTRASGIALGSYRQAARQEAMISGTVRREARPVRLWRRRGLLRESAPGPLGLAPAGPHRYRKVAA